MEARGDDRRKSRARTITVALSVIAGSLVCRNDAALRSPTSTWDSRRELLPAELIEGLAPFTFDHPDDWRIAPDAGSAGMLVQLLGSPSTTSCPGEIVSIYPMRIDRAGSLDSELSAWATAVRQNRGFRRAVSRPLIVDGRVFSSFVLDGMETAQTAEGEVCWGRVVVVPIAEDPQGDTSGLVVEMVGSSAVPGLEDAESLGRVAGGGIIMRTLRIATGPGDA